jgi:hypothetical protein
MMKKTNVMSAIILMVGLLGLSTSVSASNVTYENAYQGRLAIVAYIMQGTCRIHRTTTGIMSPGTIRSGHRHGTWPNDGSCPNPSNPTHFLIYINEDESGRDLPCGTGNGSPLYVAYNENWRLAIRAIGHNGSGYICGVNGS